jgi:hypothetical protein
MPRKHNADRRHHIPKMAFKVENWPDYEAGLRRRGSLTLWIEDGALDHWQTFGTGGQARYADAAIQSTLMVRTALKLALRQTEGLLASVITLVDLSNERRVGHGAARFWSAARCPHWASGRGRSWPLGLSTPNRAASAR